MGRIGGGCCGRGGWRECSVVAPPCPTRNRRVLIRVGELRGDLLGFVRLAARCLLQHGYLHLDTVVASELEEPHGETPPALAGSKRQLVHRLAEYWTDDAVRYVEPFAGSARLFFKLAPESALLGDINSGLIELYQVIRDHPGELHEAMSQWPNQEDEYYRVRAMSPKTLSVITRAARFIYLNRFCFNGLYRTNLSGHFNVPYGGHKSGSLPSLADLEAASRLLAGAELLSADFAVVVARVRAGDFVYLDPPYSVGSHRVFREYDPASFGPADLCRMRSAIEEIDRNGRNFRAKLCGLPRRQSHGRRVPMFECTHQEEHCRVCEPQKVHN